MIDYVNAAMYSIVRGVLFPESLFPKFTVAWGAPQHSLQVLARVGVQNEQEAPSPDPSIVRGIPGATIFLTACPRSDWATLPMAQRGWENGNIASGTSETFAGQGSNILMRPASAEYTLVCWAKDLSDLMAMQREVEFFDVYNAVSITVPTAPGSTLTETFNKMPIYVVGDAVYDWKFNEKDGKQLWYSFRQTLQVDTQWVKSATCPLIHTILTTYKDVTNAESPVTLDTITINSTGNTIHIGF